MRRAEKSDQPTCRLEDVIAVNGSYTAQQLQVISERLIAQIMGWYDRWWFRSLHVCYTTVSSGISEC